MILSGAYTCIARVEEVHRATRYSGGAFRLARFVESFPDFRLVATDAASLPRGVEALSRRDREGAIIVFARGAMPARLRFTIAHELGHMFLHDPEKPHARRQRPGWTTSEARSEAQADFFAAELLMPVWAVDRALPPVWREHGGVAREFEAQVRRLADVFWVSRAAMRVQLEHYLHLRESALGLTGSIVEHFR